MSHTVQFFLGCDPNKAKFIDNAFISAKRLDRSKAFIANRWVMDSGAFTEVMEHGRYRAAPSEYARTIRAYADNGTLVAAVAQDFMCEQAALMATGATIQQHQRWTIERYDALMDCDRASVPILPVLQGFDPADYARHVEAYGDRLAHGAWVGVGSVCKRNGTPRAIVEVLRAIHAVRPDLRLHGFGIKLTALASGEVVRHLASADSMAWSHHARKQGLDQNDIWIGRHYELRVLKTLAQHDADAPGEWALAFGTQLVRHRFRQMQAEAALAIDAA